MIQALLQYILEQLWIYVRYKCAAISDALKVEKCVSIKTMKEEIGEEYQNFHRCIE